MSAHARAGFLTAAESSEDVRRMHDEDIEGDGYVMNLTRVWAHLPAAQPKLAEVMDTAVAEGALSFRERAVLVSATASSMGDSYCSLAWGRRLARTSSPGIAARVLSRDDSGLEGPERALARWARLVVSDPNATTAADVEELRTAGYDDRQILAITLYVAARLAFSTVNDALGASPDAELGAEVPPEVRAAVTFGRSTEIGASETARADRS